MAPTNVASIVHLMEPPQHLVFLACKPHGVRQTTAAGHWLQRIDEGSIFKHLFTRSSIGGIVEHLANRRHGRRWRGRIEESDGNALGDHWCFASRDSDFAVAP